MIIEYIAIGIIIICIGIIVYIVFKKFPVLSSININTIQKFQQDKIKKELLEERLVRKFKSINVRKIVGADDNKNDAKSENNGTWFGRTCEKLRIMEKKYRDRIKVQLPENKDEQEKNKLILLNEAKKLVENEEFKLAEEKLIELISLDNKYNAAYECLADVYCEMKDYEHAKEIYFYLLRINSQDVVSPDNSERATIKNSLSAETTDDLNKSISLSNKVASYQVDLGSVYMDTTEYKKAMQCFQEAVKLEPNNPKNLNVLIEVAVKLHDIKIAEEIFEKLKSVNPENEKLDEIRQEIEQLKK